MPPHTKSDTGEGAKHETCPPSMRISMLRSSSSDRWANSGGKRTQVLPAVTESVRRCFSEKMPPSQCLYLRKAIITP